ncbi:hypothetical protein [Pseudothermotoga sp.]|nr:hypothetical protein [Pseudothermotoga sp.]MCX7812891.1 hypothetical protein [Pseudothermotoga sp.]MDW8139870.1 hypothetical protein [Pseudothermotoga sp.]
MRNLIVLLMLTSTILFGISEFIPAGYDSILLSRNNAKYYDQMKKIPLFDTLINGLGLENMIQGVVASQLVKYGTKIEQFNELLSNQILLVQKGENFLLAAGPAKEAEKLAKAVGDLLGSEMVSKAQKGYVFISNKREFIDLCLSGGGSVPNEVLKWFEDNSVWAVGYAPKLNLSGAEFESVFVVKVEQDKLTGFQRLRAKNDAAVKVLADAKPASSYALHRDTNLSGEIFIFSNVQSAASLKGTYEQIFGTIPATFSGMIAQTFGISNDLGNMVEKILGLSEKTTGRMAVSIGVAQFIQSLFETQKEGKATNPSFYAVIESKISIQEIAKTLGRGEIVADTLKIDNFTVKSDGKYVRVFSDQQSKERFSLEKALKIFDPAKHSLFVFVDLAPIVEKLLGIASQSVLVVVGTVENNSYTTNWYIK